MFRYTYINTSTHGRAIWCIRQTDDRYGIVLRRVFEHLKEAILVFHKVHLLTTVEIIFLLIMISPFLLKGATRANRYARHTR